MRPLNITLNIAPDCMLKYTFLTLYNPNPMSMSSPDTDILEVYLIYRISVRACLRKMDNIDVLNSYPTSGGRENAWMLVTSMGIHAGAMI